MASQEQLLVRVANSTACVGIVVSTALILTMIAVSYRPPDLPLEEPSKVTAAKIFGAVRNATYEGDDNIVITGEDLIDAVEFPVNQRMNYTSYNVTVADIGKCDPGSGVINCTDPGVLVAIQMANGIKFPDMGTVQYGKPVAGTSPSKCEVEWRFNNNKDKSRRMYRDFREYKLQVNTSCDYVVERIGRWHSGTRARSKNGTTKNKNTKYNSNQFWSSSRYVYYSRGGDYCKGMSQYMWSFLCALGEARYLNRTLVLDMDVCFYPEQDDKYRDFRLYFDMEHLQEGAPIVDQRQFLNRWNKWNRKHPRQQIESRQVDAFRVPPMDLHGDTSTIVWRQFSDTEDWYRVCEGESEKVIHRPWDLLWKSKQLMNIVNAICGKLEWDFDAVHVVRGHKARDKSRWPDLDRDTRPEAILEKLEKLVPQGRNIYIASNEQVEGYFDILRTRYKLHLLDDFKTLWAPQSQWYNETMQLLLSASKNISDIRHLELEAQMRAEVDSEVVFRAKRRIETFGQLTNDCKHGINSC